MSFTWLKVDIDTPKTFLAKFDFKRWSNIFNLLRGNNMNRQQLMNCLSVLDYFVGLELKGLLAQPKFLRKCVTRFGTIYTILKTWKVTLLHGRFSRFINRYINDKTVILKSKLKQGN